MSAPEADPDLVHAFVEALYFTDTGDDEDPPADAELSPEARARIERDCRAFWTRARVFVESADGEPRRAGHDFWMSRQGHGCGFWDGDWPDPQGQVLDQLAKSFPEMHVELGDDGRLHVL